LFDDTAAIDKHALDISCDFRVQTSRQERQELAWKVDRARDWLCHDRREFLRLTV